MTRQTRPSTSPDTKSPPQAGGARIPDKPRDCGPNVDTWPILDEQAGDKPKPKAADSKAAVP